MPRRTSTWGQLLALGVSAAGLVARCPAQTGAAMSIAAPAPTSDAPAPVAPEEWIQRMTAAYRAGPMVEHVTFASAGGATARTDAWVRVDAGSPDDAPPRVARLRLDAGRAIIWAQGDRVVFTHADNPTTYAERVVAGGFSSGLLRELPQSPLPQIGLALADDLPHWDPRRVRWSHAAVTNDAATLEGTLEQQRVRLVLDAATARIKSFEFKLAQGQTLAATVTRHPPEDPQTWPVSITGRAKVASPADLRALPRPIEPGQAAPTLGLMTKDLSGWSLVENLSEAKPRGASAAIGALVLVGAASDPAQVDLALRAHRASMRLARELDAQLAQGLPATPKLIARMVGVLELRDVSRERIALLDAQWRAAATARGGPAPDLLWTGGGIETLRQLAPAQTIALALIDDRQALLGVVTLEGRLLDESAIADEVRAMLREPPAGAGPSPDKKAENSPAETPAEAGPPRDK